MYVNECVLAGNLTRDPDAGTTASGIPYCRFSIAVDRSYKVDGEKVTDFFNVITWRGLAETCGQWLSKGRNVLVVGEMTTRKYTGRDGVERTGYELIANKVSFGPMPRRDEPTPPDYAKEKEAETPAQNGAADEEPYADGELPF